MEPRCCCRSCSSNGRLPNEKSGDIAIHDSFVLEYRTPSDQVPAEATGLIAEILGAMETMDMPVFDGADSYEWVASVVRTAVM